MVLTGCRSGEEFGPKTGTTVDTGGSIDTGDTGGTEGVFPQGQTVVIPRTPPNLVLPWVYPPQILIIMCGVHYQK
jgi:hypothetical protein